MRIPEVHPGPEYANEIVFRVTAMGDGTVFVEIGRVSPDTVSAALTVIAAGIDGGGLPVTSLN